MIRWADISARIRTPVKSNLKCFNFQKAGCRPSICNKPLNGELINGNKDKYMATKEAQISNHPRGDCGDIVDRNKNRECNGSDDTDKVSDEHLRKMWSAGGLQMVNGCLKVNFRECGLNDIHASGYHEQ
jgi:hypothetical protein